MNRSFTEYRFEIPAFHELNAPFPADLESLQLTKEDCFRALLRLANLEVDKFLKVPLELSNKDVDVGVCVNPPAREFHLDMSTKKYQAFWASCWPTEFASCSIAVNDRIMDGVLRLNPSRQIRAIERAVLRRVLPFSSRHNWIELVQDNPSKFRNLVKVDDFFVETKENSIAIGEVTRTLHRAPIATNGLYSTRQFMTGFFDKVEVLAETN